MHKRVVLALFLVICMAFSSLPAVNIKAADGNETLVYNKDGVEVYYGLDSVWSGAFNGHIRINNNSENDIEDWRLFFTSPNVEITNIWNGKIESTNNGNYLINNSGWNQDIKINSEVKFGFTAKGISSEIPSNVSLISVQNEVKDGFETSFEVNSDWNDGFSGAFYISNTGSKEIEDWTVEFDFDREIDTIWNGVIISHEGNHYIIKNAGYNQRIQPGQKMAIGMNGHSGSMSTANISNIKLYSYGYTGNVSNETGLVKIDTTKLNYDAENGVYFIPKDIYSINGTLENSSDVESLTYSTNNTFGLDLASGNIEVSSEWVINKMPLIIGYNELTVTATYKDKSKASDTVIIACIYDDRADGLDEAKKDTDKDGLEDYIEKMYGTDPLKYDSDEDGLSDYTELAILGTDPLDSDTDDNGILDGDEDYDKDGLSNREEEKLGTLLYGTDSDYDDLSDYDEVYVHHTDPLLKDTDNDGASDGFEVANGYDPLKKEEEFTVEKQVEVGGTKYELRLTATGENIETLKVKPVSNSVSKYGMIAGYLDPAVDFEIKGDYKKAELKVYFDASYLEIEGFVPALYYVDEENHEMVEIPGNWDGVSDFFYVEVPHFSTYIVLNKTAFDEIWENAIKAKVVDANGNTNIDLVFVTDLSGSMRGSKITTMKNSINAFIDVLDSDDRAALVSFTSTAKTIIGITDDKDILKNKVNSMSVGGLTAIYTGIERAVNMLESNSHNGYKMIIVFTDGYDEPFQETSLQSHKHFVR